ncbi:MAG: hypothetical protein IT181_13090 [Acidobacteria bacterium]|nr:hypothetical protein [Acidobacteriota bacterium]
MALSTLDSLIAGAQQPRDFVKAVTGTLVAGRPHSLFYLAGTPGAAAAPSPGIGGAALTTYAGQLPFTNPASGESKLLAMSAMATQAGQLWLCDRLWHNSGITITSTSAQAFTGAADIPARDINGAASGHGVYAGVEVSSVVGAGTPTLTLEYTNQAGTTAKTATNQIATVASSIAGTFYPIGLASGDTGIRRATGLTLSATWTSGTIHVVLYRVIAKVNVGANIPGAIDALSGALAKMYDNTVPFLVFVPNTTTTANISGSAQWAQG